MQMACWTCVGYLLKINVLCVVDPIQILNRVKVFYRIISSFENVSIAMNTIWNLSEWFE